MATGTLTYNALRTKTLKERIKTQRKIVRHSLDKSNAVRIGTTAVKPYLSLCPVGLVWFARYCGKMYSRHPFSDGGLRSRILRGNQFGALIRCQETFPTEKTFLNFLTRGPFRMDYEFGIGHVYDFRISNQQLFQALDSSC